MKSIKILSLSLAFAATQLACSTTSQHPDPRVPGARVTGCNHDTYKAQSAWFHGQGAPAGQGQIGYGHTMEELNATMNDRVEHASNDAGNCASESWTTVR